MALKCQRVARSCPVTAGYRGVASIRQIGANNKRNLIDRLEILYVLRVPTHEAPLRKLTARSTADIARRGISS
jgi:hypothetical protein